MAVYFLVITNFSQPLKLSLKLLSTFLLLLLISSCQEEEIYQITSSVKQKEKSPYKVKTVSLKQIPKVKDYLKSKSANLFYKDDQDKNEAIFDKQNIMEVINTLNQTNYSFRFTFADTPLGTFYNLIVGKTEEGELQEPYILKYTCNEDQLALYLANNENFAYLKGTISIHKFTDYLDNNTFNKGDLNCPPQYDEVGDPIPCDNITIDGISNIGGGPNNTERDTGLGNNDTSSNNNSETGASYEVPCIPTTFVKNCGGTEEDYWHTLNSCGWIGVEGENPIYTMGWDCTEALKKGGDNCPDCPSPNGGVGVNTIGLTTMRTALKNNLILDSDQLSWIGDEKNAAEVTAIYNFLENNKDPFGEYLEEAKDYVRLAMETWIDKSDFDLNKFISFQDFIPPYKNRMSSEEIDIFNSISGVKQSRYLFNAYIASNKAIELFPNSEYGWHNDKADAFRHSYFHALNLYYISVELSKLLGDAHEVDTPSALLLEKTMDLYNNGVGRNLSQSPPVIMNGYGVLQIRIQNAINNGDLVYISPLQSPYGELLPNSTLIPTNQ